MKDMPSDVGMFLRRLARSATPHPQETPTDDNSSAQLAGSTEAVHRWITDGLVAHAEFLTTSLEDPQFDNVRNVIFQELLDLNAETRRVELLLHLATVGLDQAICSSAATSQQQQPDGDPKVGRPSHLPSSTLTLLRPLLRLVHVLLKFIIAAAHGDAVLLSKLIDRRTDISGDLGARGRLSTTSRGGSAPPPPPSIAGKASRLCQTLMECTIRLPLDAASTVLHYEVTVLLLTLCTTQLHHPAVFDEQRMDIFVEAVLASDVLLSFIATLMQRMVAWGIGLLPEGTAYVYRPGYQPTYRNLYNFFGSVRSQHCVSVTEWLGRHTSQLLALLVLHQRGNGVNHASNCLRQLSHGEFVDFELLLCALERKLVICPSLVTILYVLLVDHPTFLHATLTTWPQQLCDVVTALLHLAVATAPVDSTAATAPVDARASPKVGSPNTSAALFPVVDGQPNVSHFQNVYVQYLVASVLCVLSKDRTYHELLFSRTTQSASFIQDRYIKSITVGSLTLAVCAKAVARALSESCEPLAQLYLSAIENASPFARGLHPYTSGRIMALLNTITRRLMKIEIALRGGQGAQAHQGDVMYRLLADRQMLLGPMQYLTESIAAMIEGQHRGNHTLTYELLYHRSSVFLDDLDGAADHPMDDHEESRARVHQLQEILGPLRTIVANYEAEMASVAVNHSPEDILALIDRVANSTGAFIANTMEVVDHELGSPEGRMEHQGRELLYLYQESREAHTFFVPFVWASMISEMGQPGAIRWTAGGGSVTLALFYPERTEG